MCNFQSSHMSLIKLLALDAVQSMTAKTALLHCQNGWYLDPMDTDGQPRAFCNCSVHYFHLSLN